MRTCPRCRAPLRPLFNGRVELDHCERCRGNFLEVGEASESFGPWTEPNRWVKAHCATKKGRTPLSCPLGHGHLEAYDVSWNGEHVEVDVCPTCKGLWLDESEGGHLRTIVSAHDDAKLHAETSPSLKSYFFQLLTGFPIEVWHPVRRTPVVVYTLLASLGLLFGAELFARSTLSEPAFESLLRTFALVPKDLLVGQKPWALVTHAFLHAGVPHLLGNLYFLWIFGDNVEDRLGRKAFVLLYAAAALAGALAHVASDPKSHVPMLGASGAISGLMGAYLVLFPRVKVWLVLFFIRFKLSVFWYLGFWVVLQIAMASMGAAGVAWYAHLGGFVAGAAIALPLRTRPLPAVLR